MKLFASNLYIFLFFSGVTLNSLAQSTSSSILGKSEEKSVVIQRHADLDELEATLTGVLRPFWETPAKVVSLIHHWLHAQAHVTP